MKRLYRTIMILVLCVASIDKITAMECGICLEPFSQDKPSISWCPDNTCAHANKAHKHCLSNCFNLNQKCPFCFRPMIKNVDNNDKPNSNKPRIKNIPNNNSNDIANNNKMFSLFTFGTLSCLSVPWVTYFWLMYRLQTNLQSIKQAAQTKTAMLLNLEFDYDSDILGLQESFNIDQMLSALKTNDQHSVLKTAIEQYDNALSVTHACIIHKYHHQSATHFVQKEPTLVRNLTECTEHLDHLITSFIQELGNPMRNMLISAGIGLLSGLGVLHIIKK